MRGLGQEGRVNKMWFSLGTERQYLGNGLPSFIRSGERASGGCAVQRKKGGNHNSGRPPKKGGPLMPKLSAR